MSRGRSERLIIANVGMQVVTIEVIALDQDVLIGDQVEEMRGAELEPGEEVSLLVGLTLVTKLPLTITLRWRDHDGEAKERIQKVTLS